MGDPTREEVWRPIATAPKTGARILIYRQCGNVCVAEWWEKFYISEVGGPYIPTPPMKAWVVHPQGDDVTFGLPDDATHWIPIPPPPGEGDGGPDA
ncbi:hypothetical protein RADP37_05475 (plasmid) [Roseomonas mucosa]|uniref:DUF551 domain-containing protein n=1 Tax=Roseomonas mucosa TaxID=207340 RepID=A0A4Y1MS57_9PROT|nr:hypothetical protein RADP37_05475 [Roseomonas mucosa]